MKTRTNAKSKIWPSPAVGLHTLTATKLVYFLVQPCDTHPCIRLSGSV